jgi:hypothetical protein
MPGQPQPPRLAEAFAVNAAGAYINAIPTPSQIGVTPGAASLNDGFPPLCFIDPASGGVLPSGKDFNGILFMISAWAAYLGAGQLPVYDATLQTDMGGYAIGARILQAANSAAVWISTVNGNMTDPDTGGAGWISSVALYNSTAPAAGTYTDNVLPGPSDYVLDYDATAGNIILDGFVAQRDGQQIRICKKDATANVVTVTANAGTAANQVRSVGDYALAQQYADVTIQYNAALSRWLVV